MKISKIDTFVVKAPVHDRFGGQSTNVGAFPKSDYFFEAEWGEVYSRRLEGLLVRVETEEGLHGWGESQAPIAPEVTKDVIDRLLAPMMIGADPRQTGVLWERMYRSMSVRGQVTGFMLDAISGVDIALWDIKAKAAEESVASMMGGPFSTRFSTYISGLRSPTDTGRAELGKRYLSEGHAAVKLYIGRGLEQDLAQVQTVRREIGRDKRLFCDCLWKYRLPEAEYLGHALQELGVEWIEAPLAPEDIHGHARLADALRMSVAVGEPLRTRYQFLEWFKQGALDIAQPDIARCGITEGKRIADLASAWHLPVAYHLGISCGVAIAATWQVAAATPNLYIVEHHPPMLEFANRILAGSLKMEDGHAMLPDGPGLGIDVDMNALQNYISK